jgi:hypothetical protein
MTIRYLGILFFSLFTLAETTHAQLFRGYISGTITDQQDAVIVGVTVTITNQSTKVSTSTVSNEVGFYKFAAVEPDVYTIEFTRSGLETYRVENVNVTTSQEPVINAVLRPAGIETGIEVTNAPGLELGKTNANIDRTLSVKVLTEIPPVNPNREVTRLAILAPLVSRSAGQNEYSANGQRSRNTNFSVDGVDQNDNTVSLPALRTPPEAVKELQIQTATFSAEFGRNTGAQVNLITPSGGETVHGQVWEYYRGNSLEPLSLVNQRAGLRESPRFVQNQFGASVGGPIIQQRTFFYGMVQGNLQRGAPGATNSQTANVPTPNGYAALQTVPLRSGQSASSRQGILDALSFLPEIHSQVRSYENVRTGADAPMVNGVPIEVGTIRVLVAQPQNLWYNIGRIDHQFSKADQVSYRYHYDHRDQPDATGNLQFGSKWSAANAIRVQNHALSYTRTLSPTWINEARASYVRNNLDFPERDPLSSTVTTTGFFIRGGASNFPQQRLDELFQFQNVSTAIRGRHSLKFGVDVRKNTLFNRGGANSKGTWTFSNLENLLNNSALSLVQAVTEPTTFDLTQWNQYYFFQDDIRLTRDLTINLGLRYENNTLPFGMFGAPQAEVRALGVPGPAKRDNNNWAPRVGFAYSPDAKSSIRGGLGMSYDVLFHNIILNTALTSYPRTVTQTDSNLVDVFPALRPKVATPSAPNPLSTFINVPEDIQNPTTHYWTLSVQREIGTNYLFEVGYSGNRSYHTVRQNQANPSILTDAQAAEVIRTGNPNVIPGTQARRLNPAWGSRQIIDTSGKGEYHAGYLRFDKKFSRGLQFGANYTFSANHSDSEEATVDTTITGSSPQVPQNFFDYQNDWARSVFDRPHRFAVHYLYEIPRVGVQVGGFTEFQSGQPFTIRVGADTLGNAASASVPPGRPDYNPSGVFGNDPVTDDLRTFRIPVDGTGIVTAPRTASGFLANSMPHGGTLGRNTFRGPGFQNWNLSVMKRITLPREWQMQLRGDFINLFNHDNFANPDSVMTSPSFGSNTATPLTDARQVLLGAKFVF